MSKWLLNVVFDSASSPVLPLSPPLLEPVFDSVLMLRIVPSVVGQIWVAEVAVVFGRCRGLVQEETTRRRGVKP